MRELGPYMYIYIYVYIYVPFKGYLIPSFPTKNQPEDSLFGLEA